MLRMDQVHVNQAQCAPRGQERSLDRQEEMGMSHNTVPRRFGHAIAYTSLLAGYARS